MLEQSNYTNSKLIVYYDTHNDIIKCVLVIPLTYIGHFLFEVINVRYTQLAEWIINKL